MILHFFQKVFRHITTHSILNFKVLNDCLTLVKEFEQNNFVIFMDCAICLMAPDNPEVVVCCQQVFCAKCLLNWVEVRNCCPLCIAPMGGKPVNKLTAFQSQQFDNGSLVLENEMTAIIEKMKHLDLLLKAKTETSNHYKSHFPKAHLNFVEEELRFAEENLEIASLSMSEGDRVTATSTIQAITEGLLNVESILLGESTLEDEYYDYSSDEEYEEQNYGMEEEIYMRNERERNKNAAVKNGSKKKVRMQN